MTVFKLEFRGLVSYVPKIQAGSGQAVSEMLMVLPNLRLPKKYKVRNHKGKERSIVPPTHVPALVVEQRFVGRFYRSENVREKRPDLIFERRNRRYAVYLFHFDRLSYEAPNARPLELVRESSLDDFIKRADDWKESGFATPPDDLEHDLRWVPSLARTKIKDAEIFDRTLLVEDDIPSAEKGRLVGTMNLNKGLFRTGGLRRGDEDEVLWIPFAPLGASEDGTVFAQAVASSTENIIEIPGKTLDLSFTRAGGEIEKIRLRRVEARAPVLARIMNRELEEIVRVGNRTTRPGWDVDPVVFYSLSTAWNDIEGEALPVAEIKGIGRAMGCDPSSFESWGP